MAEIPLSQSTDRQLLAAFVDFAKAYPDFPGNITAPSLNDPNYVPPYRGNAPFVISIVLMVISFLVVCARLHVRKYITAKRWDWDDYLIIPSTLATFGFTLLQCWSIREGKVGYHIYDLPVSKVLYSFKFQNLGVLLYLIAASLIKISICFFTLRLCQRQDKAGRRMIVTTLLFCIVTLIASFLMTAFQCTPTTASWDLSIRLFQEYNCASLWKDAVSWSVVYGVTDIWLIILPLRFVHKLKLPMGKKIGMFLIFIIAGVATIVAFLKLTVLKKAYDSWDPTWNFYEVQIYSDIELTLGLITASLPAFGFILVRMMPDQISTINRSPTRRSGQSWAEKAGLSAPAILPATHGRFTGDNRDLESLHSHKDDSDSTAAMTWDDSESRFMEQIARLMAPSKAMQKQMYQYKSWSDEDLPQKPASARSKNSTPAVSIQRISGLALQVISEHGHVLDEDHAPADKEEIDSEDEESQSDEDNESQFDHDERHESGSETARELDREHPHPLQSSLYLESTSSLSLVIQTPIQSQYGRER